VQVEILSLYIFGIPLGATTICLPLSFPRSSQIDIIAVDPPSLVEPFGLNSRFLFQAELVRILTPDGAGYPRRNRISLPAL
jgi:hypothetical protein